MMEISREEVDREDEGEKSPLHSLRGAEPTSELTQYEVDQIDPFSFKPPFTLCDKLLIAFNALWLFPLRMFLFIIPGIIMGSLVCLISTIGERYDPSNPTPRNRWRTFFLDKIGGGIIRFFLFGFGLQWIHFKGHSVSSKEAPIQIVTPHSCLLDVFVVGLYGTPSFVAREETRNMFFFGNIITKALRTIYVNRRDANSRTKAAEEIQRRVESGGRWPKVIIFPEGTTNNRKVVLSFKKGAFQPALPVQPLLIKYKNRLGTTTWGTSGLTQLIGLFYTLCQFHNPLEVEVLDVYKPSEEEKSDPLLYARNVQQIVARALGKPPGVQSVDDCFIMDHGASLGLPFSRCLVLCNRILTDIGLHVREIKRYLTRYASIDEDKDGWISPEDVAKFLNVPMDSYMRGLFKTSGSDSVDIEKMSFKQYLYMFVAKSRPLLKNEMFMRSIFEAFNETGHDVLRISDVFRVMSISELPWVIEPKKNTRNRRGRDGEIDRNGFGFSQDTQDDNTSMNFDEFKSMLECNLEYLLLYHESNEVALPLPSSDD